MPLKIPDEWRPRIFSLKANEPRLGRKAIHQRLQELPIPLKEKAECPSERTVGRILDDWEDLSEEERLGYRLFSWPKSMEDGALPWEASQPILDLLRHLRPFGRPVTRTVKWYWRVCLAAPDLDIGERLRIAGQFAGWEVLGDRRAEKIETIECYLAFAPWRSKESAQEYEAAIEAGHVRRMTMTSLEVSTEDSIGSAIEATDAMMGFASPVRDKVIEEAFRGPQGWKRAGPAGTQLGKPQEQKEGDDGD